MRISTKGYYAVRAMLDLAMHSLNYPVPLSNISVRQEISLSYLEQLFMKLRKAKLVKSIRGPKGGYILAKEMNKISVGDILRAVEESMSLTECVNSAAEENDCKRIDNCETRLMWQRLAQRIGAMLDSISLKELYLEGKGLMKNISLPHKFGFNI